MTAGGARSGLPVAITGLAETVPVAGRDSLETLIWRAASAALEDAGLTRADLDGVVIAASDQVDGRAISSMLTSGPAGAYLADEINTASSPGHAVALAYMQILSGTHRRLLVSSWGKASETATTVQAAERLSAEPFYERDGGISALAASALQAAAHRGSWADGDATAAAAAVAARNHRDLDAAAVAASAVMAHPLRELECPPEIDGAYSFVLERADREHAGVPLAGVGWSSDSGRVSERDLTRLEHLARAARDAYGRAGVDDPAAQVQVWELHDYSPDAEMLAYAAIGLCAEGESLALAQGAETHAGGRTPVNPGGGSVRGEAPFGGPLRKVLNAVRQVRGDAGEGQVDGVERAFAQLTTGFAGQFQTAVVVGGRA